MASTPHYYTLTPAPSHDTLIGMVSGFVDSLIGSWAPETVESVAMQWWVKGVGRFSQLLLARGPRLRLACRYRLEGGLCAQRRLRSGHWAFRP